MFTLDGISFIIYIIFRWKGETMKISSGKWTFLFIVVFSLVAGTFIGELLASYFPVFAKGFNIRLFNQASGSWLVDLNFLKFNLGLVLKLNLGSIIFLILSFIVFYKK